MKFHLFFLSILLTALVTYPYVTPKIASADDSDSKSVTVTTNQNTVVITDPASQDASLVVSDDRDTVKPHEEVLYRLVVRNPKNDDITQVKLVAYIPEFLLPKATSPEAKADPTTRTLTWDNVTLSAKSEQTFAFKAQIADQAPAGQVLRVRAEINGPGLHASGQDTTVVEGTTAAAPVTPATVTTPSGQTVRVVSPAARDVHKVTPKVIKPSAATGVADWFWLLPIGSIVTSGILGLQIKKSS